MSTSTSVPHDTERARVAERIEQLAHADFAVAARDAGCDVHIRDAAGGIATAAAGIDHILLNRVVGAGVTAPFTSADLADLVAWYDTRGIVRWFVQPSPWAMPVDLAALLATHGFVRFHRAWRKFVRGRDPVPEATSALTVRPATADDRPALAHIAADAFGFPPSLHASIAALVGRPRWHVYLSFDGDQPVGTGALFVDGDAAWLGMGATAPEFRRRGGQTAVLARRIADALDLGCRWLATETGEAVDGQPNSSFHNIVRTGFEPVHSRPNYVREAPAAT